MSNYSWLVGGLLVGAILTGFHNFPSLPNSRRTLLVALTTLLCVGIGLGEVYLVIRNALSPREWDFFAFWVPARAAASGLNFYEPASLRAVATPVHLSADFAEQILDVGFWYPPVTMLLLSPLGYLGPSVASAFWGVLNLCFLAGSITLMARLFHPAPGGGGYLLTTAIVFALRGTTSTVHLAQTNFILLMALALFWTHRRTPLGGGWIGLAAAVKPVGAFFLLQPLLLKYWRVLLGTGLTALVLGGITLASFGWTTSSAYFTSDIGSRLPLIVFTEPINQSLLATFLRARGTPSGNPLFDPFFLGTALVLVASTAWLVWRLGERHSDHGLALLFPCALLVYPAALAHYSVLLALPLMHLWQCRGEAAGGPPATIVVISVICALGWAAGGHLTFLSNLFLWCWLAWQARYLISAGSSHQQARAVAGTPWVPPAGAH